ncbi:kinesin family member 5 [Rhodotorula toruloides]|uniref:Kinesin-like protein n=1 Tax=Rhodotorula toruloides TaxID=5286 RepID=A0A511KBK1_RHOTO|nr:kinesin family member 5 [Rhodotorula toruloides]
MSSSNNIKVVCRFRPPNKIELANNGGESIVQIDEEGTTVKLQSQEAMKGPDAQGFTFDRVFQMDTKQEEVFEYGVKGIVDDVLNGYNGTVFAYGQTGSGKSHTMMGPDIDSPEMKGIIPRITEQIFASIIASPANIEYLVKVSYMEIYMEKIPENDNLPVHEDKQRGVYVKNLSEFYVGNSAEVYEVMRQGGSARAVSATNMNAESSRSHSIFVITIQARNTETGTQKTGSLFLVDLAGSEKIGKTGATGQTLEEAKKINKSLSALGMVINALTDGKSSHIPYRDSKLTRILQESLGGNSRTTLIINCSPSPYNETETLSTLRFGMRAKSIKNKARVNAELSPAELKALLKKAQRDYSNAGAYIGLLEQEVNVWREGGKVEREQWASMEKALGLGEGELEKLVGGPAKSPTPGSAPGRTTPRPPALDRISEGDISRPDTPMSGSLGADEREDLLRRQNEMEDQLAKTESQLSSREKIIGDLREELSSLKESESSALSESKSMSGEVTDLRLQLERLRYDSKEAAITSDSLKEQNAELERELEELRGGLSERESEIRASLARLDDAVNSDKPLSPDDIATLRRQLEDTTVSLREQQDKSKQVHEENDLLTRRRDELEQRLGTLEQEYEELLDKTVADEERANADHVQDIRNKLEAQYAMKLDAALNDADDLKQQIELKSQEVKNVNAKLEQARAANLELERAFKITTASIEGGKNLEDAAKDLERQHKAVAQQLADFDAMKKSLMRDLQDRCEKARSFRLASWRRKAQQRKMDFLTRNLDQLTVVQKQASSSDWSAQYGSTLTPQRPQLVDQNTILKRDVALAERKLIARNERIQNLEVLLQDANDKLNQQNAKFEARLQAVRERLDQARAQNQPAIASSLNFGRIAKPLRGGGAEAESK